ncbi:auxilin-like clathrin-binding protein required for normal clathrin function [Basidiobolus ranarum]|uniref:Auxilin-like clathrin-binding protein required for normal clathrin function n=1 Tax=Basidiobolus ranarum TaxID=34480 RepID=A0ABR2VWY6_9FUNG
MEMGFGYEQARSALELSGNDFQSAVDILVDNRNAEDKITYHKKKNIPPLPRRSHRSRNSSDEEDYNQETPAWRSEKSQYTSPWNSGRRRESEETSGFDMASFQVRKEKFMSNASTIGASVLSKANLFVKQASEKIRESIDDIQQRSENSQKEDDRFKRSGRPRWLQRHSDDDSSDEDRGRGSYNEYRDENVGRRPFSSPKQEKPPVETYNGVHRVQSQDSLRNARAPPRPPVSLKNRVPHKPPVSPKPPVASQPTRPPRSIVSATPEQLQLSEKQKAAGTDKFKLGQFGDAEELYSQAISTLPPKHDNLILLYNNRAAARIKVGDYNGVISDCDKIVELIRDEYLYPSSNDPFSFKDQLIKAITRRASAYESKEKYETAEKDFSKILSIDSNNRTGLEGVRRCQKAIKMVHGETTSKSSIPSKVLETTKGADLFSFQQPNATTAQAYSPTFGAHLDEFGFATVPSSAVHTSKTSKADIDKSEGVSRLRAQDRLAEREEEEKLRILDMVEERLNQWKSNKVGNLRAMIASLDTILWPELNWKACGLQDLIQPNQVKSKYIRAIAKLHPDKLSANESVEHKLLASGLFSILNESWDQFKAQNGL